MRSPRRLPWRGLPLLLLAGAALAAPRPQDRLATLRRRLGAGAAAQRPWAALGALARDRCDLEAARRAYDRLLAEDLLDPAAHAGHAEIHRLEGEPEEALDAALLALSTPRGRAYAPAWRAKAMALVDLGRYEAALVAARHAARLAPGDARMLEALARARFRTGDMAGAREAYERATRLDPWAEEANLRLGSGFGPRDDERPARAPPFRARFRAGTEAWASGRLAEAAAIFRALVRARPGAFQFRLGLGLVRRALRRRREVVFGGPRPPDYCDRPIPEVARLETYVRDWDALPDWAQCVIRIATGPARPWMDALLEAGARHEILGLDEALDDAPARRGLTAMTTFDGRWYGQLRGVGGRAAATGIEKLRAAASFSFNTFAHEFAHQVLRQGFPPELRARVADLYARARNTGRCLDYYAASNVDEYFAQGYEALVSLRKRGCLRDTAGHTRDELRTRDPALYAFLVEVLQVPGLSSPSPAPR